MPFRALPDVGQISLAPEGPEISVLLRAISWPLKGHEMALMKGPLQGVPESVHVRPLAIGQRPTYQSFARRAKLSLYSFYKRQSLLQKLYRGRDYARHKMPCIISTCMYGPKAHTNWDGPRAIPQHDRGLQGGLAFPRQGKACFALPYHVIGRRPMSLR